MKLAKQLEEKKTSIVGTMNRIRREIPVEIKSMKAAIHSSTIFKSNNMTRTVYQGKCYKNVILLSTVHKSVSFSDGRKKLLDSIQYYNSTKYGVDILDQKARLYTTKVASRRWPLQVFYNLLDLAAINAVIVYQEVTGNKKNRLELILKLIEELQKRLNDNVCEEAIIEIEEEDKQTDNASASSNIKGSVAKYSAQNNQEIKPQKRVINVSVLYVGDVLHTSNKASFVNFANPDLYYIIVLFVY